MLIPSTTDPGQPGTVKIRTRIDDFVGGIVLHCHVITHEDLGMIENVVIVDDTLSEEEKVHPEDIAELLHSPATHNPQVSGYYISENFNLCAP